MRIDRNCKVCDKAFVAKKSTQFFCTRSCFKKDYYRRTKEKERLELLNRKYLYHCPVCHMKHDMGFEPIENLDRLEKYICPGCGIPRTVMLQEHNNTDFTVGNIATVIHVIHSAVSSNSTTFS